MQLKESIRNTQLDDIEAAAGVSAKLYLRTAAAADCAAADAGALLATLTLPVDWMQAAAGGIKLKSVAAWADVGTGVGVCIAFRIKDNGAAACYLQGTAGLGAGELSFDNNNIAVGQAITIATFTLTAGNA